MTLSLFMCSLCTIVGLVSLKFSYLDGDLEAFESVGVEVNFDLLNVKQ